MDSSAIHAWLHCVVGGGILAGVAAGIVLIFVRFLIGLGVLGVVVYFSRSWHSVLAASARSGLWVTLKIAAYPLVGNRALQPGFDARIVWLAIVAVFGFSVGMGLLFALLARGRSLKVTVALGLLFGAGICTMDYFLINPSPAVAVEAIPAGLALALVYRWHEHHLPRHHPQPQ
jgi:hypothetical protein